MQRAIFVALTALLSVALVPTTAPAPTNGVPDHLKCYKIKDPVKLKGIVDINTLQFGLEPECRIRKAVLFCAPASKKVLEARDGKLPIVPLSILGQPLSDDRICYQIKCKKPFPPDVEVADQFGKRRIKKLRPFMLCTPAIKCCPVCGDGVCEGDEALCNCAKDCASPNPVCGDLCLQIVPVCGDGSCDRCSSPGESHENCPQDCPLDCQTCPAAGPG